MRKIITLLLLIATFNGFSQDVIIKNDKNELKVKVMEILPDMVKFKYAGRIDGPLYSIYKKEIFMIIYEDGKRETFNEATMNKIDEHAVQTPLTENDSPATESLSGEAPEKNLYSLARIATAETFDLLDIEYDVRYKLGKKKDFSIGVGFNVTYNFNSETTGYYVYATAAYRVWLSAKKQYPLTLWGSAGYAETYYAESVIGNGSLWEVGADIGLGKKGDFGLTVYTPKFESYFFGIYFKL